MTEDDVLRLRSVFIDYEHLGLAAALKSLDKWANRIREEEEYLAEIENEVREQSHRDLHEY